MSSPPAVVGEAVAGTAAAGGNRTPGRRSSSSAPAVEGSFLTRQTKHVEKSSQHRAALAAETKPAFAPVLVTDPAKLLEASPRLKGRLSESAEDRFRRLSVTEAQEREEARKALATAAQQSLPFKPAPLSPHSAKLAPTPAGLDELYSDTRRVRALAAAELRYGKPCFAPDTRSSRHSRRALLNAEESAVALVPGPASSERLAKLLQDKEAHLGRLRQSIAEEEAKVCTFKPSVSKGPPPRGSPDDRPPVKGLDTFVAKQEAARLKRAQAEAEAAKAAEELETRVVAVPKEVYTQWTAFSLADPERRKAAEERLKKVQAEMDSERTAECTFAPVLITKLPPGERAAHAQRLGTPPGIGAGRRKSQPGRGGRGGGGGTHDSPSALAAADVSSSPSGGAGITLGSGSEQAGEAAVAGDGDVTEPAVEAKPAAKGRWGW